MVGLSGKEETNPGFGIHFAGLQPLNGGNRPFPDRELGRGSAGFCFNPSFRPENRLILI